MKHLSAQVRTGELDLLTIGVIEKVKRSYLLKDLQGRLLCKSNSIETVAAGRPRIGAHAGL